MNPFSNGEKLPSFYEKYFIKEKNVNNLGIFGQKLNGWSHKLETLHEDNLGPVLKKN